MASTNSLHLGIGLGIYNVDIWKSPMSSHYEHSQVYEMVHSSNYTIIQNLYRANDAADIEAFYKDLSSNLVWKESDGFPTPGTFRSRAEIDTNVFDVLGNEWNYFRFSLEYLIDGNEHMVAVGTYRGTHRKTGRSFQARASHVWHLHDGKIDRFEQFADTHVMQAAATALSTAL